MIIGTTNVEKTTTYNLTKQELEAVLMEQAGITVNGAKVNKNLRVSFDYNMSGGYDASYDHRGSSGRWEPYVFGGVTMTVTEKSLS
jgi:hypothetical protein